MKSLLISIILIILNLNSLPTYSQTLKLKYPITLSIGYSKINILLQTQNHTITLKNSPKSAVIGLMYERPVLKNLFNTYIGGTIHSSVIDTGSYESNNTSTEYTFGNSRTFLTQSITTGVKYNLTHYFYARAGLNYTHSNIEFINQNNNLKIKSGFGYHIATGIDLATFLKFEYAFNQLSNNISGTFENNSSKSGNVYSSTMMLRYYY